MTYKPNFADPRVQQRLVRAVAFCKKYLREDRPQALGTRWIHHTDNFGNQRHPLSRYLRETLLVCVDERYNKDQGTTKKYRLNGLGLKFLEELVAKTNTQTTYSVAHLTEQFSAELTQGISYKLSSDRQWHWLQSHRRDLKRQVLAATGLVHNYDIVCACPNLLHQYSSQIPEIILDGNWQQGPMDLYLFYLRDYLKRRSEIRHQLAQEAEVDEQVIKRLINGMFQGGQISAYTQSRSFTELDGDLAKIKFLQQHEFVVGLKQDIKVIWEYLAPVMYRSTTKTKQGTTKRLAITGRQKTELYRSLERRVLNSIEFYLKETDNRYFLEHDGWTCRDEIDQIQLGNFVRDRTGFDLEFEYEKLI